MNIDNIKLGHLLAKKMEGKTSQCLPENIIAELIENKLPADKRANTFKHLNSCRDCFEVYQITSLLINDNKKDNKTNYIKSLSIAASIIFVFLIGFYYSSFYKPETKDTLSYQIKDLNSKTSLRSEVSDDKSLNIKNKKDLKKEKLTKVKTKRKPVIIKKKITEEKEQPFEIKEVAASKSLQIRTSSGNNEPLMEIEEMQEVVSYKKENSQKEVFSAKPGVFLKTSQSNKTTKNVPGKGRKKDSGKKKIRSAFLKLSYQGYIYNKINYFGKLNKDQILKLLSKWKKILPELKGIEKKIAIETITFLRKQ